MKPFGPSPDIAHALWGTVGFACIALEALRSVADCWHARAKSDCTSLELAAVSFIA